MSRRVGGLLGAVTAAIVALALWFGAATPGAAVTTEAPSPPALASLGCTIARHGDVPTAGDCPAVARGSSSALLGSVLRKGALGTTGPSSTLLVLAVAAVVVPLAVTRVRGPVAAPTGARGPPPTAS